MVFGSISKVGVLPMNLSPTSSGTIFGRMDESARTAKPIELAAQEKLLAAVASGDVPVLYANGFSVGLTNADVIIVLTLNGRPAEVLNLSYTLAKTLHLKLANVVDDFEKAARRDLLTTDDVDAANREKGK